MLSSQLAGVTRNGGSSTDERSCTSWYPGIRTSVLQNLALSVRENLEVSVLQKISISQCWGDSPVLENEYGRQGFSSTGESELSVLENLLGQAGPRHLGGFGPLGVGDEEEASFPALVLAREGERLAVVDVAVPDVDRLLVQSRPSVSTRRYRKVVVPGHPSVSTRRYSKVVVPGGIALK
eukprot:2800693-Rhodomonas_salina.2